MTLKRKITVTGAAALALALTGAGIATAGGAHAGNRSPVHGGMAAEHGGGPGMPGLGRGDGLAAAATYLGITTTELKTDLQAGKTLAQVADGTSGKTAAGLVAALVAHETTEIDAKVTAGRLTQAQADTLIAGLAARVTAVVNGTFPGPGRGGPGGPHGGGPADDLAAAATYLGITTSALEADLQSGKTLAQVADATSGKTTAGLVAALVAHETAELQTAVTAGKLSQAQADAITAHLTARFTALVDNTRPLRGYGH